MHKYIILTMCVALCACNNGGGGNGHVYSNTNTKPGNVSGGTQVGGNTGSDTNTEKPDLPKEDNNQSQENQNSLQQIVSIHQKYSAKDESERNFDYNIVGYLDKTKNELSFKTIIPFGNSMYKTCKASEGCDYLYNYNERFNSFANESCQEYSGCNQHFEEGQNFMIYCRDKDGCKVPNNLAIDLKFDLKETGAGIFNQTLMTDNNSIRDIEIALGTMNQNVPLKFSDFGYWSEHITTGEKKRFSVHSVLSGDKAKEVDMETLWVVGEIPSTHVYTGKAFVGISSGYKNYIGEDKSEAHLNRDTENGFLASGDAKLSFNTEKGAMISLLMSFADAGWYNVYTNGNEIRFFGNTKTDEKFNVSNPHTVITDHEIHYYGPNPLQPATEAVGTVQLDKVRMGDGLYRDINFSFGAVKD